MNLQKDDVIKLIVSRYVKKRQSLSKMVKIINSDFKKYDKIPSFFSWTKIKANIIKKYFPDLYEKYVIEDEPQNNKTIKIDKYLSECSDIIKQEIDNNNNLIIDAPTGAGKTTLINRYLCIDKVLLLEPTKSVVNNFKGDEKNGIHAINVDDVNDIRT